MTGRTPTVSILEKETTTKLAVLMAVLAIFGGTGIAAADAPSADVGYTVSDHLGWDTTEGELWGAAIGGAIGGAVAAYSSAGVGTGVGVAYGGLVGAA